MDNTWADLFWKLRDKKSNLYDEALMNVFRAIALSTRSPDSNDYWDDISMLRSAFKAPSYADFHSRGWLDQQFTLAVIYLLDAWSANGGELVPLLPDTRYFDERAIFTRIVSNGANLSYVEIVQFTAYVGFIVQYQQSGVDPVTFQEWMRIVYNLSINTDYNRQDDLRRSIVGLEQLLKHCDNILKYFVETDNPVSGFSPQQISEEKLKAELIFGHDAWRALIDRGEGHKYFRGQIEFLLYCSGAITTKSESAPANWENVIHTELEEAFLKYLRLSEQMFTNNGLMNLGERHWQRALLSIGDYMLRSGRNYSFLENSLNAEASWKRLLKGNSPNAFEARNILKQLWEQLSPDESIIDQLDNIIATSRILEPWREAFVQYPNAIVYCENNSVRRDETGAIYLLKRVQMNGTHAELFTY